MDCIMGFEYLDEDERDGYGWILESYFREAENENFIERKMLSTCR